MKNQPFPPKVDMPVMSADQARSLRDMAMRNSFKHREYPMGGSESGNPPLSYFLRDLIDDALVHEVAGHIPTPSILRFGSYLTELERVYDEHQGDTDAAVDAVIQVVDVLPEELLKRQQDGRLVADFFASVREHAARPPAEHESPPTTQLQDA